MTPFIREGPLSSALFEAAEVEILIRLASEVQELLSDIDGVEPLSPVSRAIDRLVPAAYGDGGDNDAEFRRFTSEGIIERKVRNAQTVIDALSHEADPTRPCRISLDAGAVQAWLRCLTDIRLAIAAGLGIEHDDDDLRITGPDRHLVEVYRWVAFVQESLIITVEADLS